MRFIADCRYVARRLWRRRVDAHDGGVALEDEVPRKNGADLLVPRAAVALEALNGEQHNLHWDPGEGKGGRSPPFRFPLRWGPVVRTTDS